MAIIQGSDRRIVKRKIAILNIDSILYWIILPLKLMKVPDFASPKSVYMLKSVEKRLSKTRKYKTVIGGAILIYSSILDFWKKVTSTIIFLWIDVFKWFRWKLTDLWNICVWRPPWISPPFWSAISQNSIYFLLWSRLPKYVIRSTLNLLVHEMTIALSLLIKIKEFRKIPKSVQSHEMTFVLLLLIFLVGVIDGSWWSLAAILVFIIFEIFPRSKFLLFFLKSFGRVQMS
jgi:hypothetical protein